MSFIEVLGITSVAYFLGFLLGITAVMNAIAEAQEKLKAKVEVKDLYPEKKND